MCVLSFMNFSDGMIGGFLLCFLLFCCLFYAWISDPMGRRRAYRRGLRREAAIKRRVAAKRRSA